MVYLANFLTIVMHATDVTDPRYTLAERARNTFLKDIQYVVVDGGSGPGSLQTQTTPQGLDKAKQIPLADRWNATWGQSAEQVSSPRNQTNRRRLITVSYPDNPGCTYSVVAADKAPRGYTTRASHLAIPNPQLCPKSMLPVPTFVQIGKYNGAQKTMLGVLVANGTYPGTAWTLVMDDDNVVVPYRVADWLGQFDPDVPLLLAGHVGPGRGKFPCLQVEDGPPNATRWGCCAYASHVCPSYVYGDPLTSASKEGKGRAEPPQSIWAVNPSSRAMAVKERCTHLKAECCRSEPWPEGARYRYPWRASAAGPFRPHFAEMWPFGGEGYVLSRGLLNALGKEYWEQCMLALQCANADHRVMTCVLNAGFSLSTMGRFPSMRHRVRPRPECAAPYAMSRPQRNGHVDFDMRCVTEQEVEKERVEDPWKAMRPKRSHGAATSEMSSSSSFKDEKGGEKGGPSLGGRKRWHGQAMLADLVGMVSPAAAGGEIGKHKAAKFQLPSR
mmetsp:Transcript_21806/g.49325  ORF Transcript_21806/g.49325 Transcript_21806/m.49325 type:complete len:500 (-) Transcript_21806:190-1689(-)